MSKFKIPLEPVIGLIVAVFVVGLAIYFYPVIQDAWLSRRYRRRKDRDF